MISWLRNLQGSWGRIGEPDYAYEFFIEALEPTGQWHALYKARHHQREAIDIIEQAIGKNQVRYHGYRLVPAPARPISEAARARFAELKARKENDEMATKKGKKERKARKPKTEGGGRTPVLAEFLKGKATTLYAKFKGKEMEATVTTDGTIEYKGKTYTSPSVAAAIACERKTCNGWTFWRLESPTGEFIDTLRGKKAA